MTCHYQAHLFPFFVSLFRLVCLSVYTLYIVSIANESVGLRSQLFFRPVSFFFTAQPAIGHGTVPAPPISFPERLRPVRRSVPPWWLNHIPLPSINTEFGGLGSPFFLSEWNTFPAVIRSVVPYLPNTLLPSSMIVCRWRVPRGEWVLTHTKAIERTATV